MSEINVPDVPHAPRARDVPLPEPVATDWLNGRPPGGWDTRWEFAPWRMPDSAAWKVSAIAWERAAIRSARERERRAELALLAGTVQP